VFSIDEVDRLEVYARSRFQQSATDGSLWRSPNIRNALLDWKRLGGLAELRSTVEGQSQNDAWLVETISKFVSSSEYAHHGGRVVERLFNVELESIDAIFGLQRTVGRLRTLLEQTHWNEEQKSAMQLVARSHEANSDRLSEVERHDEEDDPDYD
jgi:hypothetical protein